MKANLLVGQSGGCTAVINQTLVGIIEAAQANPCVNRIWGMRSGVLGILRNEYVDLTSLQKKTRIALAATPSSALGSCRYKITDQESSRIIAKLQQKNIRYLILIGGNDTAQTALKIANCAKKKKYELCVIAVPKTIDNDLPCMDHTPGYGSAATFIACATQEAGKDTEAMCEVDPIKIIEVMGRNSGWLVAAAALGKRSRCDAPHLMYFPECPFSEKEFIIDVTNIYEQIGYAVVVVAETIRDRHNRRLGERSSGVVSDLFGHRYVSGTAARLCGLVEDTLRVRARYDKPGTMLRMSMNYSSPVDQREAYLVGKKAVELATQGCTKIMVTLERTRKRPYRCTTGFVPLEKVAGVERYLPASFINKRGNFVTKAYLDYARPLVGKLPNFVRL